MAIRPIHVYYEHPDWFKPLFSELERRGIEYHRIDATRHSFDPAPAPAATGGGHGTSLPLVVNRMSPSAWKRGRAHSILYTSHYLRHLERLRAPVVNGLAAFTVETSKALQLSILQRLGLLAPRTRIVNHRGALPAAAAGLEFPLVVKPNIGGSGAGIVRFDTRRELEEAVERDAIGDSIDGVLLLQEFHEPEGGHIVRVETLEGRYLYAIRVHLGAGAGFDLCPAEICRDASGRALANGACAAGAEKSGLTVEGWEAPPEIRAEGERIAIASRLDVGGIEYLVSRRDGRRYYYDINALSNFVAEPLRVIGFDPTERLVDALLARAQVGDIAPFLHRGRAVARRTRLRVVAGAGAPGASAC